MICPKCHKDCRKLLALSRFDDCAICSPCGNKEAFEVMLRNGIISEEDYKKECDEIDRLWENIDE